MNRRDFIKTTAAVAASCALPMGLGHAKPKVAALSVPAAMGRGSQARFNTMVWLEICKHGEVFISTDGTLIPPGMARLS